MAWFCNGTHGCRSQTRGSRLFAFVALNLNATIYVFWFSKALNVNCAVLVVLKKIISSCEWDARDAWFGSQLPVMDDKALIKVTVAQHERINSIRNAATLNHDDIGALNRKST